MSEPASNEETAVTRYAEVVHDEWIAAPVETVRAQFADLDHHIRRNVHPALRFEVLERRVDGARFVQEVRLLGVKQRDVFERSALPDGSLLDTSVEGFNRGGSLHFRFTGEREGDRPGTLVRITIRLPLPPMVGPLLRPFLESRVRREVRAAALQDKADIEGLGYPDRGLGPAGSAPVPGCA
jgi:hypothetical protein